MGWLHKLGGKQLCVCLCVSSSLVELEKAIKGIVVMSTSLEETFHCIYDARVPPLWEKVPYTQRTHPHQLTHFSQQHSLNPFLSMLQKIYLHVLVLLCWHLIFPCITRCNSQLLTFNICDTLFCTCCLCVFRHL